MVVRTQWFVVATLAPIVGCFDLNNRDVDDDIPLDIESDTDTDGNSDTEMNEDSDLDCPGGMGESLCCDKDETFCGSGATSFGEACCSIPDGQTCESCWSPDDMDYAGMCLVPGQECPDQPDPE